jgi:flagellar assembly protein FliH
MALIKNADATRLVRRAIVFDLDDVDREARRLIDDARAEARAIVEEARAAARREREAAVAAGRQEGVERGLAEGLEQGRAEGRQEVLEALQPRIDQLVQAWQEALESWESRRHELLHQGREDVLAFAFTLARKIVHRVVEIDGQVAAGQVEAALALVSRPSALEVAINPEDRAVVEAILPGLVTAIGRCEDVSLRDDPAMTRGGCRVSTAGGAIDATIETQLERLADALLPAPRDGADEPEGAGGR